jgi:acetoin utilization deacetylase AcuC-like enzyme
MSVGVVADKIFENHIPSYGHPESPERVRAINDMLKEKGIISKLKQIPLRKAEKEEITLIHTESHFNRIKSTDGRSVYLDADTSTSPDSFQTALFAVGSSLNMIDEFMKGNIKRGFALIRPPGHHAESDRAMGFCLFNNIAIAGEYCIKKGMERVAIVDWDLHHGNGTQWAFWTRRDVLYISTHRWPYYPGTGSLKEVGEGEGRGYTVNLPLPGGADDSVYSGCFEEIIVPIIRNYSPDIILVSAGFDPHIDDPLGDMRVTEKGFGAMTQMLVELAEEIGAGGPFLFLEGGYSIKGLTESVEMVFRVLLKEERISLRGSIPGYLREPFLSTFRVFWKI